MLTRRDLTRLLVRIFGLIVLVSAVVGLPLSIYGFLLQLSVLQAAKAIYTRQNVAFIGASHFGPFVAHTAIGLCFLWWSGRIIDRASLAPEQDEALVESTDLRNIQISLVAVLGLYFLADGLAELCRVSFSQGLSYPAHGWPSLFWNGEIAFALEALLKLIIGILLVLGQGGP